MARINPEILSLPHVMKQNTSLELILNPAEKTGEGILSWAYQTGFTFMGQTKNNKIAENKH